METQKRNTLGRGLSALLTREMDSKDAMHSVSATARPENWTYKIAIEQIEVNPFQPRTQFDREKLLELAESIAIHDLIQPLTVRKVNKDKYQLISGERRFKAAQMAGLTEIPAYVRVANDEQMLELALIENTHREDLNPIEIALAYKRLVEECNLTQEELSGKVSKDRSTITNYLRLLKLPALIQLGLREGKITMGHARTLINIENPEAQLKVFNEISEQNLTVRESEEKARTAKRGSSGKSKAGRVETALLNKSLSAKLSLPVAVSLSNSGKGKITIGFRNKEELEKITAILNS
jgi:ParB family chromosome partitioning protein